MRRSRSHFPTPAMTTATFASSHTHRSVGLLLVVFLGQVGVSPRFLAGRINCVRAELNPCVCVWAMLPFGGGVLTLISMSPYFSESTRSISLYNYFRLIIIISLSSTFIYYRINTSPCCIVTITNPIRPHHCLCHSIASSFIYLQLWCCRPCVHRPPS